MGLIVGAIAGGLATAAGATATTAALVGAAGTAIGAGASYLSNRKKGKAAEGEAFGYRPELPGYEPIHVPSIGDVYEDSLGGIQENFAEIVGINDRANAEVARQDLARVDRFISPLMPQYRSNLRQFDKNTGEGLAGRVPFDDALGIVRDRANFGNTIGVPGTYTNATVRDLGLKRIEMMGLGADWLGKQTSIAQQLSPIDRYGRPQDYFIMPPQAMQFSLQAAGLQSQENQNVYQSGFNQANAAAMPDPAAQAQYQEQLIARYNPQARYQPYVDAVLGTYNSFKRTGSQPTNWQAGTVQNPYVAGAVPAYRPRTTDYAPMYGYS